MKRIDVLDVVCGGCLCFTLGATDHKVLQPFNLSEIPIGAQSITSQNGISWDYGFQDYLKHRIGPVCDPLGPTTINHRQDRQLPFAEPPLHPNAQLVVFIPA